MKILFSGVGECKVYEVIEMDQVPPVGADINFYSSESDETDQEWSVRTVVWLPKNTDTINGVVYDVYCVVGPARPDWSDAR